MPPVMVSAVRCGAAAAAFTAASASSSSRQGRPVPRPPSLLEAASCWTPAGSSALHCSCSIDSTASLLRRNAAWKTLPMQAHHAPSLCQQNRAFLPKRKDNIKKNKQPFESVYEKGDILGEGGFGGVFLCTHKETKIQRAAKFIPSLSLGDKVSFEAELQALSRIDHLHVMRLLEWFEDDGSYILVCQLCRGDDLQAFIEQQIEKPPHRLTEVQASNNLRQILKGLLGCHVHDVIHKDVKPDNFVFHSNDAGAPLVLIDLGLSEFGLKNHEQKVKGMNVTGTVPYLAPEVVCARGFDEKCDVWSAGCILFLMLTGRPYVETHKLELARSALQEKKRGDYLEKRLRDTDARDYMSEDALDLLTKMLETKRKPRISCEGALNHPFMKLAIKDIASSHPTSSMKDVSKEALVRIRRFCEQPALVRLACTVAARFVPARDMTEMRELYRVLDINGDGKLTYPEMEEALTGFGVSVPGDLKDLIDRISVPPRSEDEPDEGPMGNLAGPHVNYEQFLATVLPFDILRRQEYRSLVWQKITSGHGGKLCIEGLKANFPLSSDDEVRSFILNVMGNQEGTLDFATFDAMIQKAVG